jgi:CRP/FNR family cyclic AMP-dependent transcriptional regulator
VRLRKNAKIDLIKRVPLFSRCTKAQLAAIASQADEVDIAEGRTLTREGERGREFVVIIEGSADVIKNGRRINTLGSGDFVGEIALLQDMPRTATVTTTAPTRVLVLTDRAFGRVTREMPSVHESLLKALADRLQSDAI